MPPVSNLSTVRLPINQRQLRPRGISCQRHTMTAPVPSTAAVQAARLLHASGEDRVARAAPGQGYCMGHVDSAAVHWCMRDCTKPAVGRGRRAMSNGPERAPRGQHRLGVAISSIYCASQPDTGGTADRPSKADLSTSIHSLPYIIIGRSKTAVGMMPQT